MFLDLILVADCCHH